MGTLAVAAAEKTIALADWDREIPVASVSDVHLHALSRREAPFLIAA